MRCAVIQHDIVWADRKANFAALTEPIKKAADGGAMLIVLSEMFSTGFVVDDPTIAESQNGPSSTFLMQQASELGVWVTGSCPELGTDGQDKRPFNSMVVAAPGGTCTRYQKIHPFSYGKEDEHFRPGSKLVTIDIAGVGCSLFVCYDLRFATEFWKLAPMTHAYIIPANWPASRIDHWTSLMKARAIENQAYVVGCNRIGKGGHLEYNGQSRIYSPSGVALGEGGTGAEILFADIDRNVVQDLRTKFPFMQDRRN